MSYGVSRRVVCYRFADVSDERRRPGFSTHAITSNVGGSVDGGNEN